MFTVTTVSLVDKENKNQKTKNNKKMDEWDNNCHTTFGALILNF